MSEVLHSFTNEGIAEFTRWIRAGAPGTVPQDLLTHSTYAVVMPENRIFDVVEYRDRYEFGCFLVEILAPFDAHKISYNTGLWSWLAARFFDQLCPIKSDGTRSLRREYVYVLGETRVNYRHLVRTPWYLVSTHGASARFLLISARKDESAPLSRQSYLLDQLAARQFVIASPTLISAASKLYADPHTGQPRRGAGAKGRGSPRRLALIANQLSLTFDIRDMPSDKFMELLPEEFAVY
jgi:hypothetical protein